MQLIARSVRLAAVALLVAVAMLFASFSAGMAAAAPAATDAVADPATAPAAHQAEVRALEAEAVAYLTAVERIPDSVIAQGDKAVIAYVQNDKTLSGASARGLAGPWKVAKCVAAIVATVASTVVVPLKILKIKKLIKAAGGVKKTAERVIKALKKKGSLSEKAKAGFKDLGAGVVALAGVILGVDTVIANCKP